MYEAAKEVDRPEAFPYKMQLHAFHGGQVSNANNVSTLQTTNQVGWGYKLVRYVVLSNGNRWFSNVTRALPTSLPTYCLLFHGHKIEAASQLARIRDQVLYNLRWHIAKTVTH